MGEKMRTRHLLQYIKEQKKQISFAIVWVMVFYILFALFGISMTYIWYPSLLCLAMALCYMVYDFFKFRKRQMQIETAKKHIEVTMENLPEAETATEQAYQDLLKTLNQRKNKELGKVDKRYQDMEEYVTLWTHQIKTPVTAMRLLADETKESVRTELLIQLFEVEQYADMMLQYLRLEGKSNDYVLKAYSVKNMVNQAVKYYARMFISKKLSVEVHIPDQVQVVTDEKWMVFVLKQIISNALKYTKSGTITITMTEEKSDILTIEDTGIGIASCDLPRIFERGYTGYNGRRDKKATGIGLFLVKQILEQLGHEVSITSKVNAGTKVTIQFKR